MFLGEYNHTIDDKGRLTIPARFRDDLESGVVITRGLDGCLWAFGRAEWDALAEKVDKLPKTNPAARNFARLVFGKASDSIPDRQGRILLPPNLREYAEIDTETVIVGMYTRLEIWQPEKWAQMMSQVESNTDAIAAQLQDLGI
jgi:MraZ protein